MRSLRAWTADRLRYLAFVPFVSGAFLGVNACASDEELRYVAPPADDDSGADAAPPVDDASTTPDGDADAAVDVTTPPRTCSDDHFCHEPLPGTPSLRGVWGDSAGIVWAVSQEGNVLRWDGKAWTNYTTVKGALLAIWGSGPTNIWIGGDGGLFHGEGPSSDAIVFTPVPLDNSIPITSIHGFGPNDIWAVGGRSDWASEESRVLHYLGPNGDPATEWTLDPISSRVAHISRVWGTGPSDVWLGGMTFLGSPQGAVLVHGRPDGEGGTQFDDVPIRNRNGGPNSQFLQILGGAMLGDLFVVGELWNGMGAVWAGPPDPATSADAGVAWDDNTFGTYFGINAVWGTSKSDVWVAGDFGRVRHWDGTSWSLPGVTITKFPLASDLHAIWGNDKEMWIVGNDVALRRDPSLPLPKGDQ
jgi:hypothetical protein